MADEITGISYWGGSHVQDGHLQWMTWQKDSSHVQKTVDYGIIKRGLVTCYSCSWFLHGFSGPLLARQMCKIWLLDELAKRQQ